MSYKTKTRLVYSVVGYALILSMIISPFAPGYSVLAAAPEKASSSPQPAPDAALTDVVFTKTAAVEGGKEYAEAGDTIHYTLSLTNTGATTLQGVVLEDLLDSHLDLVPGSLEVTPLAYDQSLSTDEDQTLSLTLTGFDGNGDPLTFTITGEPAHGARSGLAPNLTYTPAENYYGPDSITFRVNDGNTDSREATISIDVRPVNDLPVCSPVSIVTDEDTPGSAVPVCNDIETDASLLSYEITGQPAYGSATVTAAGQLNYVPSANYNGSDSFGYRATDSDSGSSTPATASVTVNPINDAPEAHAQTLSTNEDTALSITLGETQDVDGDPLAYTITSDPTSGSLSATTTVKTYMPAADFYGADSFTFQVCETTGALLCATATINLTVEPVNDAPSFTKGADQAVAEDSGPASISAWATAISVGPANESAQSAAFQITSNTRPSLFSAAPAVSADGTLTFTPAPNATGSATITLRLVDNGGTDRGGVNASPAQTFVILVGAENDVPVVKAATFTLNENSAAGTTVGKVTYTDPDSGQTHTFSIIAGNTGGAFAINPSTGVISVADPTRLDYEATPSFALTVQVTDNGVPALAGSNTITVQLRNIDETPIVGSASFNLDENSANGTLVGTVTYTNQDAGQTHTFAITNGDPQGAFTIDAGSGEIRVANSAWVDYETAPVFNLTVSVTDGTGHTGLNTVTINLQNVNEAPALSDAAFTLSEASANGTVVGSVPMTDPDSPDTHTFAITAGNEQGAFAIGSSSGEITVADATKLDIETTPSYTLTVQVTDAGGLQDTAVIAITLTNANEAPVITSTAFSVDENAANGTPVGTVMVSDPEPTDTHTFAITAGNTGGTFAIDTASGAITIASNALLDHETNPSFSLTVQVTDAGGLQASKTITITVNDVNEAPAVTAASFTIPEDSASGTTVGTVAHTDPDPADTHVFSITDGNTGDAFSIDAASGTITVANGSKLDYETQSSYSLTVQVTDNGVPALSGTAAITIQLTNTEEAPLPGADSYETIGNTLLEVAGSSTAPAPRVYVSGNLLANDVDPENAGSLTAVAYSGTTVQGGKLDLLANGAFTYLPAKGFEGSDTFTYQVSDQAGLTATGTVAITVKAMVWYVKNNAPAGGSGRSTSPFNTLTAAQNASQVNSTIYVYRGDGTSSGQSAGITLKSNQRLIGAGVALEIPVQVNGGEATTTLLPAATRPQLGSVSSSTSVVTASDVAGVEIRGLGLVGSSNAITVSTTGSNAGSVTIQDNNIVFAGGTGIKIQSGSSAELNVNVQNNTLAATGSGVTAQNTGTGPLNIQFSDNTINSSGNALVINGGSNLKTTITAFQNNIFHTDNAGNGVSISDARFDATPGDAFQTVDGGTTSVGTAGNGVAGSGMTLTGVMGDLSFPVLEIYAEGGAGLQISSAGTFDAAAGTGFRLTSTSASSSINATGGAALLADSTTLNLQNLILNSNASTGTGVSLIKVAGTVSIPTGNIQNSVLTAFDVSNASAAITYGGAITNSQGKSVSVISAANTTLNFTGPITDTGDGIYLAGNSGSTTNFSGVLNLSTGARPAFTANTGGTLNITGAENVLTTTTGVALTLNQTTIGSGNLNFRSISASGAANGILLTNTGLSGGLKVSGSGAAGSGGTLQNTTTECISLYSAAKVELNDMNLLNCGGNGILANTVDGFIFRDGRVENAGNADGEMGMRFIQLSGPALLQDSAIVNAYENGILLENSAGLLNLTLRRMTINDNNDTYGEDGIQFRINLAAVANVLVENSTFSNLKGDGIDGLVQDTAQLDLTANGSSQFASNNGGVILTSNGMAILKTNLSNNAFQQITGTSINLASLGNSRLDGSLTGNTVSGLNAPKMPTGYGINLNQQDGSSMTVSAANNTIEALNTSDGGLNAQAIGFGRMNLTLRSNQIGQPYQGGVAGAWLTAGETSTIGNFCLDIGSSAEAGNNSIFGNGYFGVDLMNWDNGSSFIIEGLTDASAVAAHVQNNNKPVTTASAAGSFNPGTCADPVPPLLPTALASLTGLEQAPVSSAVTPDGSRIQFVSFTPARTAAQVAADSVSLELGALAPGESVTIMFDVTLPGPLAEDVLQISNQATLTSSTSGGTLFSDDPSTPTAQDATITLIYRAPVAYDDAFSMAEDGTISVTAADLLGNDSAAIGYEAGLNILNLGTPDIGSLVAQPDGSFVYTPPQDFNGVARISYTANDGKSDSNSATIAITVGAVNDAPELDNSKLFSLLPITQDAVNNPGTLVSELLASSGTDPIQDVDAGALEGIAVIAVDAAHGRWQYSTDNGSVWQELGAPSSAAARLLASDTNTRLRFVPDTLWNGTLDPALTFHAWDRSGGTNGGTLDISSAAAQTAFSSAKATASLRIDPASDLSLSMTTPDSNVLAGTQVSYTLTASNSEMADLTGVIITDTLPAGMSFVSASGECQAAGSVVTCTIASLKASTSASLTLTVQVAGSVRGTLTNHATATASEADPDYSNNEASVSVNVAQGADIYDMGDVPGDEWSDPDTDTSPNGIPLLGEFSNQTVTLTLENLPPHGMVRVAFDLFIMRSWDGNQVEWPGDLVLSRPMSVNSVVGPDHWSLQADGNYLLETTFANWSDMGFYQSFPENYPGGSYPAQTGASAVNDLGYIMPTYGNQDSTYQLSYTFDHDTDKLVLDFTGSGLQPIEDESWGLGNVRVTLFGSRDQFATLYLPIIEK